MRLEWLLLGVLLLFALAPLARRLRTPWAWPAVLALAALTATASAFLQKRIDQRVASRAQMLEKTPKEGRPGGYVGSDSCRACHPGEYASWHKSYHRTMTQHATPESVRGNFNHQEVTLEGEKYLFERRGEEYWVETPDPDLKYVQTMNRAKDPSGPLRPATLPRVWRRVGLLTGSHHMQAYWVWSRDGNLQFSLPFTYLFETEQWVPRKDVFLVKPNAPHPQQIWNLTCINCHSTAGQPGLSEHSQKFETRTAELGISCEACHGPAEEHVRHNSGLTHRYANYKRKDPDPTIINPARLDHVKSSEMCSRCHAIRYTARSADWQREGVRFHPGADIEGNAPLAVFDPVDGEAAEAQKRRTLMEASFWSDGQVRVSGRDFNGMAISGCYTRGQLSCLSCHSMHNYHSNDDQLAPRMESNQACLQCHGEYAAKLEQHTHHKSGTAGSLCYNCHMPHTSYGLLKAIRSHTINSPSVKSSLDTGRPNACNLCHLDKSLAWTQSQLAKWYNLPEVKLPEDEAKVPASALWLLRGDAGQRALIAWHMGWEPAQQASGRDWLPPYLAETLTDTYAVVRYIGQRSLKRLPNFAPLSYDYVGPDSQWNSAKAEALRLWNNRSTLIDDATFQRLRRERKDPPMQLFE